MDEGPFEGIHAALPRLLPSRAFVFFTIYNAYEMRDCTGKRPLSIHDCRGGDSALWFASGASALQIFLMTLLRQL